MDVEVRYMRGCASLETLQERLKQALESLGRTDTNVGYRLVETAAEAQHLRFIGSPTILIDGSDFFLEGDAPVAMSCRLYRTTDGVSGSPSTSQLVAALTKHELSRNGR